MLNDKIYKLLPISVKRAYMNSIVVKGYNNNNYFDEYRSRSLTEHEMQTISKFVKYSSKRHPRLLDLGCGNGTVFDTFMVSLGVELVGVDLVKKHIEHAKSILPESVFVTSDFMEYEPLYKFDLVTAFYSLYNLPKEIHGELIKKIADWLKPYGSALLLIRVRGVGEFDKQESWCGAPMAFSYGDYTEFVNHAISAHLMYKVIPHEDNDEYVWLELHKGPLL